MLKFKDTVAGLVTKQFPSLLAFAATAEARRSTRLYISRDHIDIVRRHDRATIRLARQNAVYTLDMINYFDYYFGSVKPENVQHRSGIIRLVDFSSPHHHSVEGFDDFPILCPSFAEPFVTTQQYLDLASLRAGDVVLDLGSYSGLTSIAFSKAVGGSGRVIAIEPDPRNYKAALANINAHKDRNGLANIDLMQIAVAGTTGEIAMSCEAAMGSADASLVGNYRGQVIRVPAKTLEDIAESSRLQRVDFVKMDIEGSEEAVLATAGSFLRRYRPSLVIEPHIVDGTLSEAGVMSLLRKEGYNCHRVEQIGVTLPLIFASPSA